MIHRNVCLGDVNTIIIITINNVIIQFISNRNGSIEKTIKKR